MNIAKQFYEENYKLQKVLKFGQEGCTELVIGPDGLPYVRKIINYAVPSFEMLLKLESMGLPKLYFASIIDNKTYVIEEYLSGVTLQEYINQGKHFSAKEVLEIANQLCNVLIILHEAKIIHRDIKPSNIIILNNSLIVKLLDFGTARKVNGKKIDTNILGTPGYAPPEQYGFAETDERSDIYALGKTLEQLLPVSYSGRLRSVFKKCTELDPKNRVSSAKELRMMLEDNNRNYYPYVLFGVILLICAAGMYFLGKVNDNTVGSQKQHIDSVDDKRIITSKSAENKEDDLTKVSSASDKQSEKSNFTKREVNRKLEEKKKQLDEKMASLKRLNLPDLIETKNMLTGEVSQVQPVEKWEYSISSEQHQYWCNKPGEEKTMRSSASLNVYNNSKTPLINPKIRVVFSGIALNFTEKWKNKIKHGNDWSNDLEEVRGIRFYPGTYIAKEIEIQHYGTIAPGSAYYFYSLRGHSRYSIIESEMDKPLTAVISLYGNDGQTVVVQSIIRMQFRDARIK